MRRKDRLVLHRAAAVPASEPRPSGSDSDGVAGEERQTGGTLSVGGDGEDDEDKYMREARYVTRLEERTRTQSRVEKCL